MAAWLYSETRVRRQFRVLAEEAVTGPRGQVFSLRLLRQILAEDRREYMFWMGLFGAGNLAVIAQLVVIFAEQLRLPSSVRIGRLSVAPTVALPIFTPWWARLFDGTHVVAYRARQGWALVIATIIMCLATFTGWLPVLWFGAIALGSANAGANLGWNLGHNDFVFHRPCPALHGGSRHVDGRARGDCSATGYSLAGAIGFNLMRRDLRK